MSLARGFIIRNEEGSADKKYAMQVPDGGTFKASIMPGHKSPVSVHKFILRKGRAYVLETLCKKNVKIMMGCLKFSPRRVSFL